MKMNCKSGRIMRARGEFAAVKAGFTVTLVRKFVPLTEINNASYIMN